MSDPRMIQTPAPLIPPAETPKGNVGVLAEILERLDAIEDNLGIRRRTGKPHEPLEGSTVQPMTDEA